MDLNLLVALDALLQEGSVQGAADRLHLSAPAMSRTLARIRRATGDEVLVRTGRTMTPTPRALELRVETRELVQRASAVLTPSRALDLASLERTFTLRGHDALTSALGAALTERAAAAGPGITLRFLPEGGGDSTDLARGQVDLEVGSTTPSLPELASESLGTDRMVATFGAGHPLADGELTAERFAAAAHVAVSRRGRARGPVDDALAELGLARRVLAVLPTSAAALDLVARTTAVAVVAERLCAPTLRLLGLRARPLPFALPPVPVVLAWHHRADRDPTHAWLRAQAREALAEALHGAAGQPARDLRP